MRILCALSSLVSKIRSSKLAGEGAWIASGQFGTAIGVLFLTRVLTEIYPPEMFGTANLYLGISAFVYSIFCAPLTWAILRFYPEYRRTGEIYQFQCTINSALIWTTSPLVILLLLCGMFYCVITSAPMLHFVLIAGILIVDVIKSNKTSYLSAARKQRPYALWLLADTCARPLGAIILSYFFLTTTQSLLLGYLAGSASVLLIFLLTVKPIELTVVDTLPSDNLQIEQALRSYVMPLVPLAVITGITSLSDRYIIGSFLGVDQAGIYVAAYGLIGRPFLIVGAIIEQMLRPRYFEYISSGDYKSGRIVISKWLLVTTIVCVLGVLLVAVTKNDIATLLLGKKYHSSVTLMTWIATGHALLVISYVFEMVCYAHKQTSAILFIRIAGVFACIFISVPFIYLFGMRGAAASVPLYFGFQMVAALIAARKISNGATIEHLSQSNI